MATESRRLEMHADLSSSDRKLLPGGRRPRPDDKQALAELMFTAYQGTVDYSGESISDAEGDIEELYCGSYGELLTDYSYVIEREQTIVCASLITNFKGVPLLAYAMTSPTLQKRGLAKAAISNSMQDLFDGGHEYLQLVVNPKNLNAISLYGNLGFRPLTSVA